MNGLSKILFFLFIGALFLPLLQREYQFVEENELDGDYQLASKPLYHPDSFKNGSFQANYERFLKDSLGFHASLIRIRNQFNYSLLNDVNSYGVQMGENEMMFPKSYIESYYGENYAGDDRLGSFIQKVKTVQEGLAQKGVSFMILLAPGKASVYPELIPENLRLDSMPIRNNYSKLMELCQNNDINILDARSFLLTLKGKIESQLYPNYGVHWSGNAVSYVADTLLKYIQDQFDISMPRLVRKEGYYTLKEFRSTDYDIGESMNLLWHAADDSLYYPILEFTNLSPQDKKPKLLACGDSFFQSFYNFYPILDSAFSASSGYYYYNRTVIWPPRYYGHNFTTSLLDISMEVRNKDLIILEMTDENIAKLGYGFIDELYRYVTDPPLTENQITQINEEKNKQQTIDDAYHYHQIAGYSFEDMKESIARKRVLDKFILTDQEYNDLISDIMNNIKNNPEWFQKIKDQAAARGISVEENMRANAEWVVDQEYRR